MFTSPARLSLKHNQLVLVFKDRPDETHTIPIEDLGMVIIDNPQISISLPLLNALSDNNVAIVFCNDKGVPSSILWNLDANYTQCLVLNAQIDADGRQKRKWWRQTILAKITNQARLLQKIGKEGNKLSPFYTFQTDKEIESKEGIAARIYFQELFGKDFIRDRNQPGINAMLNYGYTILRSACIKSLLGAGLFPAIGIHHHHRENPFPLADDVMEPYRPYVDELVFMLWANGLSELDKKCKSELIGILYSDVRLGKIIRPLQIGLQMTAASLAACYKNERADISYPVVE